ncbi:GNAT family N-acetyltransferase [Pedobacter sp. N36a]|uniref:GNAT family N-acetyltransferase n=1 Tax=Pedobacter sp. N36a TaxID=2767996 RepID=UPI001656AD35|nr:GNAT family N-acetyltransferase [Pedobacter sp. N36a]MBC8988149.1 GNAT family N-acetyltransferase [Pedobacter sp. N36a]
MEIKNLENIDLEKLVAVINLSFSDYIVPLQLNLEILKAKIKAEDIKLELSLGVFDGDEMVGCMLHGLRDTEEGLTVYNGATGVIPDQRGKGLVRKMYEYLLPELKKLEVRKMVLEVITGNHPAIKAYEKMGYTVRRTLDCYKGKLEVKKNQQVSTLKEIDLVDWPQLVSFWDTKPSWQNEIQSLENTKENCRFVGAYQKDLLVGYAVFNPTSRKVNQLAVAKDYRNKGIGTELCSYINEAVGQQEVYVFNVDHNAASILAFLKAQGLREHLSQFEMSRTV